MNKSIKIIIVLMLLIIVSYVVYGLINNSNDSNINNPNTSGETNFVQSGDEETNINEHIDIVYDLTSGDDKIILTGTGSGDITKTTYFFENDKLSKIVVTEEIMEQDESSGDIAAAVYSGMMQDSSINQIYSSIELNGNIITMVLRQEYIDAYSGLSFEQIYERQVQAIKDFEEENN